MPKFDTKTLALLERQREVRVEAVRPDGSKIRVPIWVVVDGDDVFVRSWRGERGRCYQAAVDKPDEVALHARSRAIPARVQRAVDDESVARCSRALERKYAGDPSTPSMLRAEVLGTTLRVEPRET